MTAQILTGIMAEGLGRKTSLILCFFIAGTACILYTPLQSLSEVASYICLLLGKFGSSCSFTFMYLITTEVMPTVYRGTAFGLTSLCGRAGSFLAPLLSSVFGSSFMYIFGALGILSAVCSLLVRETKGELMADTTEQEMKSINKANFH